MKHSLSLILLATAAPVFAEDARQLDAHEHGVGTLNIAIEGTAVGMEFEAPGADIVGFEYAAKSDADMAAIDAAVDTLSAPLDLFAMPDAAACGVVEAKAELESEEGHEDHDEDHEDHEHEEHDEEDHEEHADEEHEDHDHEEHADHDEEEHEEHADHDDHDEEEAGHTEFHAEYMLTCDNPDALTTITFAYFDAFPNAQEVEVQIISAAGASAFEVERDAPVLDLGR